MTKNIPKKFLSAVFYYGGLYHILRSFNNILGRKLTIVTYHRVTDKRLENIHASLPFLFTRMASFEKHVVFLKRHYSIISFADLNRYLKEDSLPSNALIITFDDGYEDFYWHAYPVLKQHNVKAVLFLTVSMIDRHSASCFWWDRAYYYLKTLADKGTIEVRDSAIRRMVEGFKKDASALFQELNLKGTDEISRLLDGIQESFGISDDLLYESNRMLDWTQVNEMQSLIEIGSHTYSHKNLPLLEDDEVSREVAMSKEIIRSRTGFDTIVFSYPHGNVNPMIEDQLKISGYLFGVTTQKGINDIHNHYLLKRINVWEQTGSINNSFCGNFLLMKLAGV